MTSAFFWGFPPRVVVNPYRRFWTTCRSHLLRRWSRKSRNWCRYWR